MDPRGFEGLFKFNNMKELQEEFIGRGQVKGFKFTQIEQNCHAYLYEVSDNINTWYEVFYKKENNLYNCVSYPSNKAFGAWAWTYHTIEKAKDKFDDISNEGDIKEFKEVNK